MAGSRENREYLSDFLKSLTQKQFEWGIVLEGKKEIPALVYEVNLSKKNDLLIDSVLQILQAKKMVDVKKIIVRKYKDEIKRIAYAITNFNIDKIKSCNKDEIINSACRLNEKFTFQKSSTENAPIPANDSPLQKKAS